MRKHRTSSNSRREVSTSSKIAKKKKKAIKKKKLLLPENGPPRHNLSTKRFTEGVRGHGSGREEESESRTKFTEKTTGTRNLWVQKKKPKITKAYGQQPAKTLPEVGGQKRSGKMK